MVKVIRALDPSEKIKVTAFQADETALKISSGIFGGSVTDEKAQIE